MMVRTLVDEDCLPGFYSVSWDGRDGNSIILPNGIYFYSLKVDDFTAVQKAVLMR
jgi:hypothetical protein